MNKNINSITKARELNQLILLFRNNCARHYKWKMAYGEDCFGVKNGEVVFVHKINESNKFQLYKLCEDDFNIIDNLHIKNMDYIEMTKFIEVLMIFITCRKKVGTITK